MNTVARNLQVKTFRSYGVRYGTIFIHLIGWLSRSFSRDEGRIAEAVEVLKTVPTPPGFHRGEVMVDGQADMHCPALCRWTVKVADRDRP